MLNGMSGPCLEGQRTAVICRWLIVVHRRDRNKSIVSSERKSPHLSLVHGGNPTDPVRLSRAQVADRLGISVSTVRRYEGARLHPQIGADGVHWFAAEEVAALAAELANEPRMQRRLRNAADAGATGARGAARPAARSADEVAAMVFERLEQRQTLAEIVIGVRVAPERVRELHAQWSQGLVEYHLRTVRAPYGPLERDFVRIEADELAARLAELPEGLTRVSVGRYRGEFQSENPEGEGSYFAHVVELGGFLVAGPCELTEITRRFGGGAYRVTAYSLEPPTLRWEVIAKGLRAAT
jgi:transcriptional regulator with XRE-family HTH domain